jgi:hypothetical protein
VTVSNARYARDAGVSTLYKFRPYSTAEDRERVRQIIEEHRIFFARPKDLNDRLDLKPLLQITRGASDAETRQLLMDDAENTWARNQTPEPERARNRRQLETMPLDVFEQEAMQRTHERLENYWVFSLAATRDCVKLWSRYADHRRGLCLHFSSEWPSPFVLAQRVDYQKRRPILPVPFGKLTSHDIAVIATLTKTLKWKHEEEYRMVRYPGVSFREVKLYFDGQYAHFPAESLTGFTVGLRMREAEIRDIRQMAARHDPPLNVYRPWPIQHRLIA